MEILRSLLKEGSSGTVIWKYNMWGAEGAASVTFDKNCKNVIEALVETGVIESEDELYTKEDMDRINEKGEAFD